MPPHAEYGISDSAMAIPVPEGLDFTEAAEVYWAVPAFGGIHRLMRRWNSVDRLKIDRKMVQEHYLFSACNYSVFKCRNSIVSDWILNGAGQSFIKVRQVDNSQSGIRGITLV